MNILTVYATTDKQKFPCAYPDYNAKRIDTTFFVDLFVAWKMGGENGIRDTYNKCHKAYKDNVKYYTEFIGALNHMLWMTYDQMGDCPISRLFNELWSKANGYGIDHFEGDDLNFMCMVLD